MLSDAQNRVNLYTLTATCESLFTDVDLDLRTSIRFLVSGGSQSMKTSLRLLAAILGLSFATLVSAGDFVSRVVQVGDTFTIDVPGDRFLVIRNFTQEGPFSAATIRGSVKATDRTGLEATMLTATIADPDPANLLEPVNNVVIAGPSTVTVTGGDTTCFITYRRGED